MAEGIAGLRCCGCGKTLVIAKCFVRWRAPEYPGAADEFFAEHISCEGHGNAAFTAEIPYRFFEWCTEDELFTSEEVNRGFVLG